MKRISMMHHRIPSFVSLFSLVALLALTLPAETSFSDSEQKPLVVSTSISAPTHYQSADDLRSNPVMFIENTGQWDERARFQVWGGLAGTMWLAEDAIWITVVKPEETIRQVDNSLDSQLRWSLEDREDKAQRRGVNIKLSFVGANPQPRIETFDRLDTVVSYFYGNDPEQWRPDVPVWGRVRYVDLYPNVDLEITGEGGKIVPRLVMQPNADAHVVRLRVEGADAVTVNKDTLHFNTIAGEFVWPLPRADESHGASFAVEPSGIQRFDVVALYTPTNCPWSPVGDDQRALAENPSDLLYGTFLGGIDDDTGSAIAVDSVGSAYVTGWSAVSWGDFSNKPGAFIYYYRTIFVVKLNSTGSGLVYATFLGGSNDDFASDIALDETGRAYVTGSTTSGDFPTTPDTFDQSFDGGSDGFLVKLNPDGSGLDYATFLGGSGDDRGTGIAIDVAGNAYVTGETDSSDFPTTPDAFDPSSNNLISNAFVAKLDPTGSMLGYSTYLSGNEWEWSGRIAVDGDGSAYVTGTTWSSSFPTTPGAFDPTPSYGPAAYVVKLDPSGNELTYSTFLSGTYNDYGRGIDVDSLGNAYVIGETDSSDFPVTPGTFDPSYNGGGDAFVVKLNPEGSGLAYATYLGGSYPDRGQMIAVDDADSAYVVGLTMSIDFPTTPDAFDSIVNDLDAFVAKLNSEGNGLAYATFLGGSGLEDSYGIVVDEVESVYVTGYTGSSDFPTTPGAFDPSYNGHGDAFVAKLAMSGPPLAVDLASFTAVQLGDSVLVTWETASELDSAGFNLYRASSADGAGRALLTFVPSQSPGSSQGASYGYADTTAESTQAYWFWLEDIDLGGATLLYGPVSTTASAPTAVILSTLSIEAVQGVNKSWPQVVLIAGLALAFGIRQVAKS